MRLILLFFALLLCQTSNGLTFFGDTYREYADNDKVAVKVNNIIDPRSPLPFDYYSLPVCKPKKITYDYRNLGQVLRGDLLKSSLYEVHMGKDVMCQVLENCSVTLNAKQAKKLTDLIRDEYHADWYLDDLPGAMASKSSDVRRVGFRLGSYDSTLQKAYFNNHVDLVAYYREAESNPGKNVVVGFFIRPKSITDLSECSPTSLNTKKQEVEEGAVIKFSYSVEWRYDGDTQWRHRWDPYILRIDTTVHTLSLFNSIIILIGLSGVVAFILLRILRHEMALRMESHSEDDAIGWKKVAREVFRNPTGGALLAPVIGTGVQTLVVMLVILVLGLFGVFGPAYQGGLISWSIAIYVFAGVFGGYTSARLYKLWESKAVNSAADIPYRWQRNALKTALGLPCIIVSSLFVLNIFIWAKHASSAISFWTFVALSMIVLCNIPLVMISAYVGHRQETIRNPQQVAPFPRTIIYDEWYVRTLPCALIAGLLPFMMVFIELRFLIRMLWQHQLFYMFGTLFVDSILLMISCIEVSVVVTYIQLSKQHYRWWWRSFWISTGSTFYVFLYTIYYFHLHSGIHRFTASLLYFVYSMLIVAVYGLTTGTAGFLMCYLFIRYIYSSIPTA